MMIDETIHPQGNGFCPIRSTAVTFIDCFKACAMYSKKHGMCAVLLIADVIYNRL